VIAVSAPPTHNGFESAQVRTLVGVVAGAPDPLRSQIARADVGPQGSGIVVGMRNGPTLDLGSSARLAAKWASATRVLAAPTSIGASEIDVRLPERPAARGFTGTQNPRL
jgi:hypothetical protein